MQKLWKNKNFQKLYGLLNKYLFSRFPLWLRASFQEKVRAWNWEPVAPSQRRDIRLSQFRKDNPSFSVEEGAIEFAKFVKKESKKGPISYLYIDDPHNNLIELDFENNFYGESVVENIHSIEVTGGKLALNNAVIHRCTYKSYSEFKITNSIVGLLDISKCQRIEIYNSFVLEINFVKGAFPNLKMFNSKFDAFIFDYKPNELFLSKTVELKNINFGVKSGLFLYFEAQNLRNFRRNLEHLENTLAANTIRVFELRAERRLEPWFTKQIGRFYDWGSLYGFSTTRPFVLLVLLWGFTSMIVFFADGALLVHEDFYYIGWQETLIDSDWWQSFYLTVKSPFNFLAIFGTEELVIARYHWVRWLLIIQGLISMGLIIMIAFGLRKRFKIS